jgi:hypothetical protein
VEGGKKTHTHTHTKLRVYISSIERDPAGIIIIYPQPPPPPKPWDFTRFLDPSNPAVEREKNFFQLVKAAGDDYPGTQKFG